ncbi:flagellar basal-body MS-ring/collar protein FliF [Parvularcula sp. LCG005]|uniref:flagellar basal-body MS-ring/collar protein FliF n=1 Tax=Parvularcula sp. LCG005 TaxID=3078805 RepID=UPI0029428FF2|nr:flagellar basal-body MS-ring/collar protein FliF [Parvularcula sp. LCG005]WOI52697.1 flagellar basal-body MS-ring/collar protein FliF [Parvularcula sp. LCG005]
MNQTNLLGTFQALTLRQRIIAGLSTVAVIACVWAAVLIGTKEGDALLFAGLDPQVAGEIATELDGMSVNYDIRGSGIYVPTSERDRLRLEMARLGLPAVSGDGYELLDSLNGFSTTADMFDAAYWRAKEGELTRTIMAMPGVKSARVHLGVTRSSAFRRQMDDKSASVTVVSPGGLTKEQARSIQYLTALAVANLSPEHVAVIDSARGVITGPGGTADNMGSDVDARTAELESRLQRMLEAHVGYGNARVTVAMDIDRQRMAQTERLIDPDTRQIASRSLMEERDVEDVTGGPVTVASNLPDGDVEAEDENPIKRTKRNEQVVYTGTEIERVTEQAAGSIRRLSVAVLINERFTTNEEGELVPQPRSAEELETLEALIGSAAGIDTERGDSLTLRTLPFDSPAVDEIAAPSFVDTYVMPNAVDSAKLVFLGLMAIVLGLFVVKPALTPKAPPVTEAEIASEQRQLPEDAASLLTMLTQENPKDAAAILDAWFEDEEQAA